MRGNDLLAAIAAELRGRLPKLRSCEVHDGKWDASELKRWTVRTPAVLIAWLGTTRTETPGEAWTDCSQQLAAYVVTRDQEGLSRGAAARNLVDWLLLYVPRVRWGFSSASDASSAAGIGTATDLRAENLYSGAIDKTGVALWAVTWRQALRLGPARRCPPSSTPRPRTTRTRPSIRRETRHDVRREQAHPAARRGAQGEADPRGVSGVRAAARVEGCHAL